MMEHRYDYRAFINANLIGNYRYRDNCVLVQLGSPSIVFCSNHVDLEFFHSVRDDSYEDGQKKRRHSIFYGYILSVSPQGVRFNRLKCLKPANRREEWTPHVIEEIVNVAIAIMAELEKYKV